MILVDATYINSFGGKTILELFIEKVILSKIKYHFILDSRLKSRWIKKINTNNYTLINPSHINRRNFYLKNLNRFSSILCLSNIPPPVYNSVKTSVFFHNRLLINPLNHKISFRNRLINFLKFSYIKYYNKNDYNWIVQTPNVSKLLSESLNIDSGQISTYPILKEEFGSFDIKKNSNDFVYVSSGVSHKNHARLLKAFINAAHKVNKNITLNLTLNKEELAKNIYPDNLKVKFHGTLNRDRVNELYNTSKFAIYPSLVESFGLPLIEATNHGCKVISSDLPYVHEIIKPSLTFNPYSIDSISNAILKAINSDNLSETKVLVENKLDNFIEFIISQDVQK